MPVPSGQQEQWQVPPSPSTWPISFVGISFSVKNFLHVLSHDTWHDFKSRNLADTISYGKIAMDAIINMI